MPTSPHHTPVTTGADGLPYWVLNECAAELGDIIAGLINLSINKGNVPMFLPHGNKHMLRLYKKSLKYVVALILNPYL